MMRKLVAASVLVLGLLVAGCEYHSEEAMEKGDHCLYRGAQSLDRAIKERLRDSSGYEAHRGTMRISYRYALGTEQGKEAMVHDVTMGFSAKNAFGARVAGKAWGVMRSDTCRVSLSRIQ